MGFFKKRAEEEPEKELKEETEEEKTEEGENSEEQILTAQLQGDDSITFDNAMKIPAFSACVNKICDTISMIPIKLYKRNGDQVEEVKDSRVNILNLDTGDTLDGVQFKYAMVKDYFGKGGYAYINRIGNDVKSLHYVKNEEISFRHNTDPIFKEYKIEVQGKPYQPYQFVKLLRNTRNGMYGKSIVEENKDILLVAYHSLKYEKNLVKTGGNKKGFITAAKKLTDPAIKKLKAAWRKLYQNNYENVVILNDGATFKESSNTSIEMQLNENKKANSDEICKIFNMPPEMISGGVTEQIKINFIQYCINPILNKIAAALNRDMLLETEKSDYFFEADTSELTKGDIKTRYEAYEIACRNGFLQIDEVRKKENNPALGMNFIKLGLQDVLYDPDTKEMYVPNMDGGKKKLGEKGEEQDVDSVEE